MKPNKAYFNSVNRCLNKKQRRLNAIAEVQAQQPVVKSEKEMLLEIMYMIHALTMAGNFNGANLIDVITVRAFAEAQIQNLKPIIEAEKNKEKQPELSIVSK
jgi:hypothetical protein